MCFFVDSLRLPIRLVRQKAANELESLDNVRDIEFGILYL